MIKVTDSKLQCSVLKHPDYNPGNLLNSLISNHGLKNDAELARKLELSPPVISKIRSRKAVVTDSILVRIHDQTGMQINEVRRLMGVEAKAQAAQ